MAEDPQEARRVRGQALLEVSREDLEPFGLGELEERIQRLEAEIARARAQIDRKRSTRAAADALFAKRD